ncbi:hypothetical protein SK128_022556, partial [Halocaridina rubra]
GEGLPVLDPWPLGNDFPRVRSLGHGFVIASPEHLDHGSRHLGNAILCSPDGFSFLNI